MVILKSCLFFQREHCTLKCFVILFLKPFCIIVYLRVFLYYCLMQFTNVAFRFTRPWVNTARPTGAYWSGTARSYSACTESTCSWLYLCCRLYCWVMLTQAYVGSYGRWIDGDIIRGKVQNSLFVKWLNMASLLVYRHTLHTHVVSYLDEH